MTSRKYSRIKVYVSQLIVTSNFINHTALLSVNITHKQERISAVILFYIITIVFKCGRPTEGHLMSSDCSESCKHHHITLILNTVILVANFQNQRKAIIGRIL